MREKHEEELRKKKDEEKEREETKFDYLTLLANTTKKYSLIRRGMAPSGQIQFKSSINKKSISK